MNVDGKIILKLNLERLVWDFMDWIDLAQDRDERMALVNTVINIQVP
jgi:hypothetical protein